jgi:putative transposase
MSHSDSITKIKICWSLHCNGVSPEGIPEQLGIHRATVYRWIKGVKFKGIRKFIQDYRDAKKGRRQPRIVVKLHVYAVREKYHKCCGEKIKYFLKREYQETISVSTIYRILREKYQLRSKWKKYCKRGHVKKGLKPRESIQIDTVEFGQVFAFTSIDTYTKEAHVVLRPDLEAVSGKEALKKHLKYFKSIDHIQRDGGSEFKAEWNEYAPKHVKSIRTARPYKKNEQAFIERFNGILRKECLGYAEYKTTDIPELQDKVNTYLKYYNTKRPHLSLGMKTPLEYAMSHLT